MEIEVLKIFSNQFEEQVEFYDNLMGFECNRLSKNSLEIHAGNTRLVFERSARKFYYHFAFLVPTGCLYSAIKFVESKEISLLPLNGDKIIHFDTGEAIYFYDPDGNVVEFIERPTLNYLSKTDFSITDIIKINEIGLPVADPVEMSEALVTKFGIVPYKSAPMRDRFCWVGDFNGAIIVSLTGRNWLPTQKPGIVNDFSLTYTEAEKTFYLSFENNNIIAGLPNSN